MEKTEETEKRICPVCRISISQRNVGLNRSGTQRCQCKECGVTYTLNPKTRAYPEEVRKLAIKQYYTGLSGRGVAKIHGFSIHNVLRWIKKTEHTVDKPQHKN